LQTGTRQEVAAPENMEEYNYYRYKVMPESRIGSTYSDSLHIYLSSGRIHVLLLSSKTPQLEHLCPRGSSNKKKLKKRPIVALIGTGMDVEHEDLRQAIWINPQRLHNLSIFAPEEVPTINIINETISIIIFLI